MNALIYEFFNYICRLFYVFVGIIYINRRDYREVKVVLKFVER